VRETRRPDTVFWVDPAAVRDDHLTLDPEESHHLLHVHRAVAGTPFVAVDGAGSTYECLLASSERGVAVGSVKHRATDLGELPVPITLLVGLPDSGPSETVVSLAVPLGVSAIDFVACSRSGRPPLGDPRLARLTRLAVSALKQSRRSRLPVIRSTPSLEAGVGLLAPGARFVADPEGQPGLRPAEGAMAGSISLAVGPPGGFTPEEVADLKNAGFEPISLGYSRLATETAAITLLAVARNYLK